jgi:hypothetical protein
VDQFPSGEWITFRAARPQDFPERMALAWETGGRIPETHHKLDNAALCLGSRIRLRLQTAGSPSVLRFVERCVIPYLYGYSHFSKTGAMPFGELHHGELGSLQELASLLGMEMGPAIPYCVLATMQKRRANKHPCACGSGRRLGRCHNGKVNALRDRVGRVVLRKEMQTIAAAFREASSQKSAAPPLNQAGDTLSWRDAIREVACGPILPSWAMPRRQSNNQRFDLRSGLAIFSRLKSTTWRWWPRFVPDGTEWPVG